MASKSLPSPLSAFGGLLLVATVAATASMPHHGHDAQDHLSLHHRARHNDDEGIAPVPTVLVDFDGYSTRVSPAPASAGEKETEDARAVTASATSTATINRTLCTLSESATIHVKFATEYYAAKYPGINWGFKWVGEMWWPSERQAARWWAIRGNTECDGLVGPGWSAAAIAMSPLVDTAWVDPSATATELSDKAKHKTFSRSVPTDAVGAALVSEVMSSLGWTKSNVFCVDDTYGRSLFNGFKDTWSGLNNTLDATLCLPSDASDEAVNVAAERFLASNTRTLYMIFRETDPSAVKMLERLRPHASTLNLFFPESVCALETVASMRSGLCLYYAQNLTSIDSYLTAYKAKNFSSDIKDLVSMGGDRAEVGPLNDQLASYAIFVHDSVHHMMKAMYEHKISNSTEKLYKYLRTVVSSGATGTIRLNERGDRIAIDAKVVNYHHNKNGSFIVGYLHDGKYDPVNGTATKYSFLGQAPSTTIASDSKPIPATSSSSSSTLPYIVAGAAVIFLLIVAVVTWILFLRPKTRDNSNAPKDPRKPYAMVFTDIQASTRLWASAPEDMGEAIDLHHAVIRKLISKFDGYEVKTIGDSFMVAFQKPKPALDFSLAVQHALFEAPWNPAAPIDETYQEIMEETEQGVSSLPIGAAYDSVWNGLRVRIGVHFGSGEIKKDETTLGFDYYGTVVNTAARVEAVGHGGQVLVSEDAMVAITDSGRSPLDSREAIALDLGAQPLRGLPEPITLIQVLPIRFKSRTFQPLRLDIEVDDHDDAIGSNSQAVTDDQRSRADDQRSKGFEGAASSAASVATSAPQDIQAVCTFLAKRLSRNAHVEPAVFQIVFEVLKTMFSTAKPKFRSTTFKALAERWRAPPLRVPAELRSSAQGLTASDSTLLSVLLKAFAATESSKKLGHGLTGAALRAGARRSTFETKSVASADTDRDAGAESVGVASRTSLTLPIPEITKISSE